MSYTVTFTEKWGRQSWKVSHTCPKYTNDRIPHVEVGSAQTDTHSSGETYTLSNIHARNGAVMWDVDGCLNGKHKAHFTVAKFRTNDEALAVLEEYM